MVALRHARRAADGGKSFPRGAWAASVAGTATATESPADGLNLTGDGTNAAIVDRPFVTVPGRAYVVTFTATAAVTCRIGSTAGGTEVVGDTAGAISPFNSIRFVALGTQTWVRFFKVAAVLAKVSAVTCKRDTG